jgi:hypothetical protein
MTHIYSSIAYALRLNEKRLLNSDESFASIIKKIKSYREKEEEDTKYINFFLSKAAKKKMKSPQSYEAVKSLVDEIELLRSWLAPNSGIEWKSPIHHLIKRTPFATAAGDSCLYGGGGFSTGLNIWWHLTWPDWVIRRTRLYLPNNKKGNMVSINVLEFITIIINYAGALTVLGKEEGITDDPFPVLLNFCDNTSAIHWANHACKESLMGRALGRMLCMLLIDSRLGINAKYIKGTENDIADEISRVKETNADSSYDYSKLKQMFPILKSCREFQPSRGLCSMIWQCVRTQSSPSLDQIQAAKREGLGKLIS